MADLNKKGNTLSNYLVSFAGAAKTAQSLMSTGEDPMTIKEFRFKVNITADSKIESETDVHLNMWRMDMKEKMTSTFEHNTGLEIECTITPLWSIDK